MKYSEVLVLIEARSGSQDTFKVMKNFIFTNSISGTRKKLKSWEIDPKYSNKLTIIAFEKGTGNLVVAEEGDENTEDFVLVEKDQWEKALKEKAIKQIGNNYNEFLNWLKEGGINPKGYLLDLKDAFGKTFKY